MKIIFAGTPDFAAAALNAIAAAGFDIPLVLTQPDRPKGRGMQLQASPVKQAAQALGLRVEQPEKLRGNAEALALLREMDADIMVVAAYGLILPQDVLDAPKHGCLNIHASLLPRWRGAAPIQRAIEAGDAETGVCIMQMDAGLDTGAVVSEHRCPILPGDTANEVHDKLMRLGAAAIVADLQTLQREGSLKATPTSPPKSANKTTTCALPCVISTQATPALSTPKTSSAPCRSTSPSASSKTPSATASPPISGYPHPPHG